MVIYIPAKSVVSEILHSQILKNQIIVLYQAGIYKRERQKYRNTEIQKDRKTKRHTINGILMIDISF